MRRRAAIRVLYLIAIAGCEAEKVFDSDAATGIPDSCEEVVVECPYRTWTEADYDPETCEEPDPFTCFDGEFYETPQQESCPDNNPDHPGCGGRDAKVEVRGSQACAACTSLDGDVYYGHPVYTGDVGESCAGENQAEPPWVFIRAVVCEAGGA